MKAKISLFLCMIGMLGLSQTAFALSTSNSTTSSSTRKPMYREITPNAGPRVAYGIDMFVTADFLYWKTRQDGSVYGLAGVFNGAPTPAEAFDRLSSGREAEVKFGWDPGFKAGAGLNFWHDGWDVYGEYTWIHGHGSDSIARDNGIIPETPLPGSVTDGILFADRAESRSSLHFNVFDLELGRNFYVSQFLMLRPHIGFKGTWQRQDWKTRYFSPGDFEIEITNGAPVAITGPYRLRQKSKYYGVGIRTGLDTAWHFTTNWSIFGDMAWTAMWSRYLLKRKDVVSDETTEQKRVAIDSNSRFYDVKYIGELQLGLRFEMWFLDDRYHIQIQAAWEEQVWINHMKFIAGLATSSFFDLTLHGLTAKIRFDF